MFCELQQGAANTSSMHSLGFLVCKHIADLKCIHDVAHILDITENLLHNSGKVSYPTKLRVAYCDLPTPTHHGSLIGSFDRVSILLEL